MGRQGVSLWNHTEELVVAAAFVVKVLQLMEALKGQNASFSVGISGEEWGSQEGQNVCISTRGEKKLPIFLSRERWDKITLASDSYSRSSDLIIDAVSIPCINSFFFFLPF